MGSKHLQRLLPLIFQLCCLGSDALAQVYIQGTVIDKDTQKPIPDVIVQYGSSVQAYTYTDAKGKFRIPEMSENIIHFQCFGYKTRSVPKSSIIQNPQVILELNPVSLNPVVISPDDADKLLDEAMQNTKKNLLTDRHVSYLLHFLQTKTSDTLQNEVYMKYATTIKGRDLKKNLKRERVPYTFNLIDVKRLQKTEIPTSELYGAEYHASHLFTFGKSVNNETIKSLSADSSLIILNIKPLEGREGWANGVITIDKKDMVILSMEVESVDSIMENQPYKKHMWQQIKAMKKHGYFSFKKYGDKYFMSDCFTFYRFRIIDEYDKQEDVSYYCDVDFRGFVEKSQLRNRKLSGFCQELFYFPDSTDKEFWLETFDEEAALYYDGSGMAENKKQNFNIWKALLGGVPLAVLLLLI